MDLVEGLNESIKHIFLINCKSVLIKILSIKSIDTKSTKKQEKKEEKLTPIIYLIA